MGINYSAKFAMQLDASGVVTGLAPMGVSPIQTPMNGGESVKAITIPGTKVAETFAKNPQMGNLAGAIGQALSAAQFVITANGNQKVAEVITTGQNGQMTAMPFQAFAMQLFSTTGLPKQPGAMQAFFGAVYQSALMPADETLKTTMAADIIQFRSEISNH